MSIGFNGSTVDYFTCSNGVRHGGSSAKDVLSRIISKLVTNGQINLIRANKHSLVPSHSLFVDDIMLFYRGDARSLMDISKLLNDYGNSSGQYCNLSKSLIYTGGMSNDRHNNLANIIGFTMASPLLFI